MDESSEILVEVLYQLRALNSTLDQISDGLFHLNLHLGADVSSWTGGSAQSIAAQVRSADPVGTVRGAIKWYDPARGFGFVAPADGGEQIFLHGSVLPGNFVPGEGQVVHCEVMEGENGPIAIALSVD